MWNAKRGSNEIDYESRTVTVSSQRSASSPYKHVLQMTQTLGANALVSAHKVRIWLNLPPHTAWTPLSQQDTFSATHEHWTPRQYLYSLLVTLWCYLKYLLRLLCSRSRRIWVTIIRTYIRTYVLRYVCMCVHIPLLSQVTYVHNWAASQSHLLFPSVLCHTSFQPLFCGTLSLSS